jgi:23S rRNA pseudouridine2605 synthase
MENRKPAGRTGRRFDKQDGRENTSRKPAGKTFEKSGRAPAKSYDRTERPASRTYDKPERPAARSYDRPEKAISGKYDKEGKIVVKKLAKGEKPPVRHSKNDPEQIRLNRFIANSGVCSRRDADDHIKNGLITVNGKQVTDLGIKVTYDDDVRFKNKKLSAEKKVYILMNKPKDYVTTVEDPHAEHTVLELIGDECPERVYPVGRLDKATTGVLLLTNDGDLAGKLTHPKYKRRKIYHVFLDNPVTKNDLFKLTEGIELDGVTVIADAVSYADADDKSQIGIELHSGQNRVIRRMFETLGYKVKKLDRVYFAGLTKKNVQRGKWRFLNDKEISMLKRGIF